MRVRRSALWILLAISLVSAKSSAYRTTVAVNAHQSHGLHAAPFMQGNSGAILAVSKDAPKLPIAVDGSKNPELIPDELAYRHFIKATASSKSEADIKRRDFFLKRAGLTAPDRLIFAAAVGNVSAQLDDIRDQRIAGGTTLSRSTLENLKQLEDLAFADAQTRIRSMLTPLGAAKLDAHIQEYIKSRIVIVDGPKGPMTGAPR